MTSPDSRTELICRASDCLRKNDIKTARSLIQTVLNQLPEHAEANYLNSEMLLRLCHPVAALQASNQAVISEPNNEFYLAHQVHCLLHAGQNRQALEQANTLSKQLVSSPFACDILNQVFTALGELEQACQMAEKAISFSPDNLHLQFNCATALRAIGEMNRAEAIYDNIINKKPDDTEAYKNRSDLRIQTLNNNHIIELTEALSKTTHWQGRVQLGVALSKELEDIQDYADAFTHLQQANKTRRQHMNYDVSNDVDTMQCLQQTFTSATKKQGVDNSEPLFILGLPRTGSTLLERILGMHPDVYSAGELPNFAVAMVKNIQENNLGKRLDRQQMIAQSLNLDCTQLGIQYLESTRPSTGHTRHFIDKMPNNFLYIGLIQRALPTAKVIHLQRDPIDTCYAIYKTLFKQAYPFSYSLEDMANYYIAYWRLMAHWRKTLPGYVLDVAYEDMVDRPENTIRRILQHCNLSWHDQLLAFYNSTTPTNTASAAQVRQPIYTSSKQKWRRYEQQLQPLIKILGDAGVL